jgi:FlaG/FlaF family flagellin (archaellin)
MRSQEEAVNEVTAEILVVALVLVMAAIILIIVFGVLPQIQQSAYLATEVRFQQKQGVPVLSITHLGGDTVTFKDTTAGPHLARVYIDTPEGSFTALPEQIASTFRTGDRVYIYYNGTGYALTSDLTGASAVPFPSEDMRIRIVDDTSKLLIQDWRTAGYGPATPAPTSTATPIPTNTSTPTPTATATTTTTATPTPTATSTTYIISVSWSPGGLGTISPPGITPGTVSAAAGASQTFTFTPRTNKAITSISLDGTQVSSGGATGQTLTYTITNIQAAHTLTATFA